MANILFPVAKLPATVTQLLDMAGFKITNLGAPVLTSDAARLQDTMGITIPVLNSTGVTINVALSK